MRVTITGQIVAFRYEDAKTGNKIGQIDLLQAGSDTEPTKIVQIYIPSRDYVKMILESMQNGINPYLTVLAYLEISKELHIHVKEILRIDQIGGVEDGGAAAL